MVLSLESWPTFPIFCGYSDIPFIIFLLQRRQRTPKNGVGSQVASKSRPDLTRLQTFLWAVQNYKASGCEMLLPILPDSIVLSWQSVSYLCVLDVGSAQALQCTSYLSTFDSSCAFRGLVERFRFRRRTSAETRQDSLALQLCVGVLTSSQHDRWTWNIAWHAFWTFPTKRSYGYKSATSASELSWDLGTLLALDTNPTESLWDHSFSLAGLLNGSVMGCSATVLSIFSWLPQF